MTIQTHITKEMVQEFDRRSRDLIGAIKKAIGDFYADPPAGWERWENWRTPHPWETKAMPNLSCYQEDIDNAISAFDMGDFHPIDKVGSYYSSLSKDMDFDMTWMTENDRIAITKSIDAATEIADRIHRIGYEMRHRSA
jgi:hypothetical protein